MEAVLCLGYGPMPSISLSKPSSTFAAPVSTKLHFGYNHSFISVSNGGFNTRRRCHHFCNPGPLALDRSNSSMPSGNEKGVGKVVRGAIGASLALACALSIIGCGSKLNLKAIAGPKQQLYQKAPSFQQITPTPPKKKALKSLLDVTVNLSSKDVSRPGKEVTSGPAALPASRQLPPAKYQIDQIIKMEAVSQMKSGQPDEALRRLYTEYYRYAMSDPETAYNMSMVLVEILISQGKYQDAYEFMKKHDQKISDLDVRPTLYKAIVCTMLDMDDEAQTLWEEFVKSEVGFSPYGY